MQNALTRQPKPNMRNLQEILGDAHGDPPDAANILQLAHRARKAKAAGNRDDWRDTVNEILYTARKSQLTQEKKINDLEKKGREELNKVLDEKNELKQKLMSREVTNKAIKLIEEGKREEAFWILGATNIDPTVHSNLAKHLYRQEAIKANAGDPDAQRIIRTYDQLPEDIRLAEYFSREILPQIDATRDPNISSKQTTAPEAQPTEQAPPMLPPGVDTLQPDHQQNLDTIMRPQKTQPMQPAGVETPMATPQQTNTQQVNPLTHGWTAPDAFENFMKFSGTYRPHSQSTSATRLSDDSQFIEMAMRNGKTYDEAVALLQELNTKQTTARGLTGDAAMLQQLRQEFPNASMEELRSFFTSPSSASTRESAMAEKLRLFREQFGREPTEEELARIFGTDGGIVKSDNDTYLKRIKESPYLLSSDRDLMRSLNAKLPRERATIATKSMLDEIEETRKSQIAALQPFYDGDTKQMSHELEVNPEGFYENLASKLKAAGRWTEDVRQLLFPDYQLGTVSIVNHLLPTGFERDILERAIQTLDGQLPSRKINDANNVSIQTIQLIQDMKELLNTRSLDKKVVPDHIKVHMTNIAGWFGVDFRPDEIIESQVTVGRLFAMFMKSISGATISDREAERLKSSFAGWDENTRVTTAKLTGMDQQLQKDIYTIYSDYFGTKRGRQAVELMYYKANAFDPKRRNFRNIRQRLILGEQNRRYKNLTYKQIIDGLAKKAAIFTNTGEELTKAAYSELRSALSDIRNEKIMKSGNPASAFGQRFSQENKDYLRSWINEAEDPMELFESISGWMPLDITKRSDQISRSIDSKLNLFEKRYLGALRDAGKLTNETKKQVGMLKAKVANIKRLEVLAFRQETADDFIQRIKAHPGWNTIVEKLELTDEVLRQLWHETQKRGF